MVAEAEAEALRHGPCLHDRAEPVDVTPSSLSPPWYQATTRCARVCAWRVCVRGGVCAIVSCLCACAH